MQTTFTDRLNKNYALGIIVLVMIFTSGCTEQPSLPVAEESFSSDVLPVSYRLNFLSLHPHGYVIGARGKILYKIISDGNETKFINRFSDPVKATHVTANGTIFVAIDVDHWDPSTPARLYRSLDDGKTFQHVMTTSGGGILWWSIASERIGTVYVGEYGAYGPDLSRTVWRSVDNGENWKAVFKPAGSGNLHIHRLAVDPYDNSIWVTVGDYENRGIFRSSDHGDSWDHVLNSQATSVVFKEQEIYWGEDTKSHPGVTRMDRRTGKSELALDLGGRGNYGGSAYDMAVGKSGAVYVSFMKYPDQDHTASLWKESNGNWSVLLHLKSEQGKGAGLETIAGPDSGGWLYVRGYKIRDTSR